jgi:hypothetical protein
MLTPNQEPAPPHPLSIRENLPDLLADGPQAWFPFGVPTFSAWQIPLIRAPLVDDLPTSATAFDKRGQTADPRTTLLHFYVADRKLRTQILQPQRFVASFEGAWGLTSPDFSIGAAMPLQDRVQAVWANRAVGAYYQSRGLRVVPHIRWCDSRDFGYCFLGVEDGSPVAVSNHGCWRSAEMRRAFLDGLPVLIERIRPSVLFVHGTVDNHLFRQLGSRTELIHLEPDRTQARRRAA